MLHDIGTVTEYDNHTVSYEHAGGHVAVALTAGAGWDAERLDITGARSDVGPKQFLREVLEEHPRGDPAREFGGCVSDQAERKPDTAARRLVDGGLIRKLRDNPLERLS